MFISKLSWEALVSPLAGPNAPRQTPNIQREGPSRSPAVPDFSDESTSEPTLFRTATRRGPLAAYVVDSDDRLIMANNEALTLLKSTYELERSPELAEVVPPAVRRHVNSLRSAVIVPGAQQLVRISADLCCRACELRDDVGVYLLIIFERMARRNVALANLEKYGLTPRERDVARLLLLGLTSRSIAAKLGATTNTVESHTKRILTKVGAQTRAALVWKILARDSEGSAI